MPQEVRLVRRAGQGPAPALALPPLASGRIRPALRLAEAAGIGIGSRPFPRIEDFGFRIPDTSYLGMPGFRSIRNSECAIWNRSLHGPRQYLGMPGFRSIRNSECAIWNRSLHGPRSFQVV